MVEHLLRIPGMANAAAATVGRFRAGIVGFMAEALLENEGQLFVASPYWSQPNFLIRAATAAVPWKRRLAETTVVVASTSR